jgi:hypothetical protein
MKRVPAKKLHPQLPQAPTGRILAPTSIAFNKQLLE